MRLLKKSYKQTTDHYKLITEFEQKENLKPEIENGLRSIFLLSQNFPLRDVKDFFSGKNFSLTESFEELEASYELIKFGFYKQAMISLRVAFDIGLFSIYWSVVGVENEEFKKWISSKKDTPYKNKQFWNKYRENDKIRKFDDDFGLIKEIKEVGLSDFVHTKGILFSNFGEFQREIRGQDKFGNFEIWTNHFKQIVKIIEILHLLKFPTLNLQYSTDFLISKFGTFDRIPQFGGGFGNEMDCVFSYIPKDQKEFIKLLSQNDEDVKYVKNLLSNLPDLSNEEMKNIITEEQKCKIELSGGFENWEKSVYLIDDRIDKEMIKNLKQWAEKKNLMNFESIIENRKRADNTQYKKLGK